jgi:hypothetical protein
MANQQHVGLTDLPPEMLNSVFAFVSASIQVLLNATYDGLDTCERGHGLDLPCELRTVRQHDTSHVGDSPT